MKNSEKKTFMLGSIFFLVVAHSCSTSVEVKNPNDIGVQKAVPNTALYDKHHKPTPLA